MAISIAAMGLLNQQTPLWIFICILAWYGSSMSIIFTAVSTLAVSELSENNASAGSTYLSVIQQVGISISITISAMILDTYRYVIGEHGDQLQQAFNYTFLTIAQFGILLLWVLSYLKKEDGASNLYKK